MRGDIDGRARQLPCPECQVPAGRACEDNEGRPFRGMVHTQRAQAAREAAAGA